MFGGKKDEVCLICEASGTENEPIKRCRTSECKGRYCPTCFATLKNVCTICQHPVEYGDVSDISEEIDSSDEDSDGRKSEKQQTSEKEEFLTFKEMEVRERFRDVESNILIDYAKLGDLVDDSETKILHEKTPKSIKKAKLKKSLKTQIKMSMYKEIRLKLQNLIARVKKRKSNETLRRKAVLKVEFAEKVNNIKKLKERKRSEHKSLLANKHASGVSSRFDSYLLEGEQLDYKKLKEKVREKIKLLKENKGLESRSVEHNNSSKTGKKSDKKSPSEDSDGSFNKNYLTYYFVESEKDCTYYTQPWRDGKSSSTDSFLVDEKPENYLM